MIIFSFRFRDGVLFGGFWDIPLRIFLFFSCGHFDISDEFSSLFLSVLGISVQLARLRWLQGIRGHFEGMMNEIERAWMIAFRGCGCFLWMGRD